MEISLICFNIHKGYGWHKLQGRRKFIEIEHHIRTQSPDLIFFQEITGSQIKAFTLDIWNHYCYGKNAVYLTGHHGNAIFSKFPIHFIENFNLSTFRMEKRGLLHSIIKFPDERNVHLLCVHLGLFKKSRELQYKMILNYIKSIISSDDPIILGGDFNDWGSHATQPLVHEFGLHEAFLTLHGNYAKTFPSWAPLLKLDRVYIRHLTVVSAEIMKEKSWRSLSDHLALKVVLNI